jgi:hypothetical protein
MRFSGIVQGDVVDLVVLCDYRDMEPVGKVFKLGQYRRQEAIVFRERNRNKSVYWTELELEAPEILLLRNCIEIVVKSQVFSISVLFEKRIVDSISKDVAVFSLSFDISKAS